MFTPKYTITHTILKHIGTIEAAREVIMHAPLVPLYEKKFRQEALLRTVHHGTHVEGNPLNIQEVKEVLSGEWVRARNRDIQEIINYRSAIACIDAFPQDAQINLGTVLNIHRLTTANVLPKSQCGSLRGASVLVRNSWTGQTTYTPPPAREVRTQLEDFLRWLHGVESKSVHPVLKAGITHYSIVRIHPFTDGNGRTARAVATLSLFKDGYDIKKFFSLEEYFDRDAPRYYQALQSASIQLVVSESERDVTDWLEYFTEGVAQELSHIKERVQRLSQDVRMRKRVGGQIGLSDRQMKLVEFIEDHGSISNTDWRKLFPIVSDDTILRDLKDLIKKQVVRKRGRTKAAVYLLR